jgi:hypothetical protein
MAQSPLTRGQSFVFLPQQEAEPVKNNLLLAYPTVLHKKTCIKSCSEVVTAGKNPLIQKNDNAFSFGGTQLAMSGCNAFTHAVESGVESGTQPKQSWEWLHVRGKQMGGDFSPSNLVAGTYHGNSSMIEFENALTAYARFFASHAPQSATFTITWTASCHPANSHVGEWILIEWEVSFPTPQEKKAFAEGVDHKLFSERGNMAFKPCRDTIWTIFDSTNLVEKCRTG